MNVPRGVGAFIFVALLLTLPVASLHHGLANVGKRTSLPIIRRAGSAGCIGFRRIQGSRLPLRGGDADDEDASQADGEGDAVQNEATGEEREDQADRASSEDEATGLVSKGGYRAAFGVVVGSEAGASLFNLLLTAAMGAGMIWTRIQVRSNGVESGWFGNPVIIDIFIVLLFGCTLLQLPMFFIQAAREVGRSTLITGLYQDIFGRKQTSDLSADEQKMRLERQLMMLKAMRFVSILSVVFIMRRARGKKAASQDAIGTESGSPPCGEVCEAAGQKASSGEEMAGTLRSFWNDSVKNLKAFVSSQMGAAVGDISKQASEETASGNTDETAPQLSGDSKPAQTCDVATSAQQGQSEEGSPVGRFISWVKSKADVPAAFAPKLRDGGDAVQQTEDADSASGGEGAIKLRPGTEEETNSEEGVADAEEGGAEGDAKAKAPSGMMDMIPQQLRPYAHGAVLVGALGTLVKQVFELGGTRWVRLKNLREDAPLHSNPQKQADQLSGIVATAFEEMGMRRTHYIKILSAALAAVGSAQGILKMFQDAPVKGHEPIWLSSSLARYISGINGHMAWLVASLVLGQMGHYDKSALFYLDRPKAWTIWRQQGMVRGRVCAQPQAKGNFSLSVVINMEDGAKMKHEHVFNLTDYSSKNGTFMAKAFAKDIQTKVVGVLPWLGEGNGTLPLTDGFLADGYVVRTEDPQDIDMDKMMDSEEEVDDDDTDEELYEHNDDDDDDDDDK